MRAASAAAVFKLLRLVFDTAVLRFPVFDFRSISFNLAFMNLTEQMTRLAKQAKAASRELARLTTAEKNTCLLAMATALEQNANAIKSPTRSTWRWAQN